MRRHQKGGPYRRRNTIDTVIGPCTVHFDSRRDTYTVRDSHDRLIGSVFKDGPHSFTPAGSRAQFGSVDGAVRAIAIAMVAA